MQSANIPIGTCKIQPRIQRKAKALNTTPRDPQDLSYQPLSHSPQLFLGIDATADVDCEGNIQNW